MTHIQTELEKTQLEQAKTELLQELRLSMQAEKEAVLEQNMEKLDELTTKASVLMGRIDDIDANLRELVSPILDGQNTLVPLTEEQQRLIAEMKQLHRQMTGELIKQRTIVVEQMKELREADDLVGIYRKEMAVEGAFVDRKK